MSHSPTCSTHSSSYNLCVEQPNSLSYLRGQNVPHRRASCISHSPFSAGFVSPFFPGSTIVSNYSYTTPMLLYRHPQYYEDSHINHMVHRGFAFPNVAYAAMPLARNQSFAYFSRSVNANFRQPSSHLNVAPTQNLLKTDGTATPFRLASERPPAASPACTAVHQNPKLNFYDLAGPAARVPPIEAIRPFHGNFNHNNLCFTPRFRSESTQNKAQYSEICKFGSKEAATNVYQHHELDEKRSFTNLKDQAAVSSSFLQSQNSVVSRPNCAQEVELDISNCSAISSSAQIVTPALPPANPVATNLHNSSTAVFMKTMPSLNVSSLPESKHATVASQDIIRVPKAIEPVTRISLSLAKSSAAGPNTAPHFLGALHAKNKQENSLTNVGTYSLNSVTSATVISNPSIFPIIANANGSIVTFLAKKANFLGSAATIVAGSSVPIENREDHANKSNSDATYTNTLARSFSTVVSDGSVLRHDASNAILMTSTEPCMTDNNVVSVVDNMAPVSASTNKMVILNSSSNISTTPACAENFAASVVNNTIAPILSKRTLITPTLAPPLIDLGAPPPETPAATSPAAALVSTAITSAPVIIDSLSSATHTNLISTAPEAANSISVAFTDNCLQSSILIANINVSTELPVMSGPFTVSTAPLPSSSAVAQLSAPIVNASSCKPILPQVMSSTPLPRISIATTVDKNDESCLPSTVINLNSIPDISCHNSLSACNADSVANIPSMMAEPFPIVAIAPTEEKPATDSTIATANENSPFSSVRRFPVYNTKSIATNTGAPEYSNKSALISDTYNSFFLGTNSGLSLDNDVSSLSSVDPASTCNNFFDTATSVSSITVANTHNTENTGRFFTSSNLPLITPMLARASNLAALPSTKLQLISALADTNNNNDSDYYAAAAELSPVSHLGNPKEITSSCEENQTLGLDLLTSDTYCSVSRVVNNLSQISVSTIAPLESIIDDTLTAARGGSASDGLNKKGENAGNKELKDKLELSSSQLQSSLNLGASSSATTRKHRESLSLSSTKMAKAKGPSVTQPKKDVSSKNKCNQLPVVANAAVIKRLTTTSLPAAHSINSKISKKLPILNIAEPCKTTTTAVSSDISSSNANSDQENAMPNKKEKKNNRDTQKLMYSTSKSSALPYAAKTSCVAPKGAAPNKKTAISSSLLVQQQKPKSVIGERVTRCRTSANNSTMMTPREKKIPLFDAEMLAQLSTGSFFSQFSARTSKDSQRQLSNSDSRIIEASMSHLSLSENVAHKSKRNSDLAKLSALQRIRQKKKSNLTNATKVDEKMLIKSRLEELEIKRKKQRENWNNCQFPSTCLPLEHTPQPSKITKEDKCRRSSLNVCSLGY